MKVEIWPSCRDLDEARYDLPRGWVDDLPAECLRYDHAIAGAGDIDLAVVGIGVNGHVGFNEPGTDPALGTHVTALTEVSRRAQAPWFGGQLDLVPERAITVGCDRASHDPIQTWPRSPDMRMDKRPPVE